MRDMVSDNGQIGKINRILAIAAGLVTLCTVLIWGVPGIDPMMWGDVAEISGLRPPSAIFPGLWRVLTGWMFWLFGTDAAIKALVGLGALASGFCTYLTCLIVRQILALLIRTAQPHPVWSDRIAPGFSFLAAVLFGISSPMACISQLFSSDLLRLTIVLGLVHVSLRWFTVGGRWRLFPAMALMGVLAAESAVGFLIPVLFMGFYIAVWHCVLDGLFAQPEKLPEPADLPKWRMFFLFLGGLALGVWINATAFIALDGAEAHGWSVATVYFRYGTGYLRLVLSAASIVGWVLGFGFCVIPFMVALRLFPLVARDDQPMPFRHGALLFFVGFLALMQSGAIPATRFWTFESDIIAVHSGFLMTLFLFCAMATVGIFGAAFAFECQRTYLSPDENEFETPPGILLRGLVPAIGVLVLVLAAFTVPKPIETEMQRIVDDAVEETVAECGDAAWLFTDGRLDPAIEIAAARRESPLRTLNMMSGADAWEAFVRARGFTPGTEDYRMVQTGVPALLRMWAGEKTNGMDNVALQLGFEFWKRDQRSLPRLSGVLGREKGMDEAAAAAGVERTRALAERILALAPKVEEADPSPALASAFSAVNWRISRFARLRSDAKLANALDEANSALRHMLSAIEYERLRTFMQLTPREGLEIALRRANYVEALRYAAAVLKNDADDPQGNFAMGMSAIMDKRYKDAELYLLKILKRRPKEPAALNNLSIVCRKQRKYREAEDYARRAIEILPTSPEVNQTLQDALKKAP